jgi:hypothetical protein
VHNLLGLIKTNAELEEAGRPLKELVLNRVFLGNPGTGVPACWEQLVLDVFIF